MALLAQVPTKDKGLSREKSFVVTTLKDSFSRSEKLSFKFCP